MRQEEAASRVDAVVTGEGEGVTQAVARRLGALGTTDFFRFLLSIDVWPSRFFRVGSLLG